MASTIISRSYDFTTGLIGQTFGNWVVLDDLGVRGKNGRYFLCRCKCGKECSVKGCDLRHGRSRSCQNCPLINPPKLVCENGHDLARTRKRDQRGRPYCGECKENRRKQWRKQPEIQKKEKAYSSRYYFQSRGITRDEFDALLAQQGGSCAICKTTDWGWRGRHIDHDHETNKIRGILCTKCNTGLGLFRDNPDFLKSAIRYLGKR